MSTPRDPARRRSPSLNSSEDSQLIPHAQEERQRVKGDIINRDLQTANFKNFDEANDTLTGASRLPAVISRHSSDADKHRSDAENLSDQDETPTSSPDGKKWNKLEAMKTKFDQGSTLRVKDRPNPNMVYRAGKKEETKIPRKRCRSLISCSVGANAFPSKLKFINGKNNVQKCLEKHDFDNVNEATHSMKLSSIFKKTYSRHCISASYAKIKHVHYDSDDTDKSLLKKSRNQPYTGITDTLIDKELRFKVKEFLQKPQPKASTPSLRLKKIPDVQLHEDGPGSNHHIESMKEFTGVPINTDTCPLMSHFKDRKWYYQDKSGKCRYLRVPESPIPPVSFVFTKD